MLLLLFSLLILLLRLLLHMKSNSTIYFQHMKKKQHHNNIKRYTGKANFNFTVEEHGKTSPCSISTQVYPKQMCKCLLPLICFKNYKEEIRQSQLYFYLFILCKSVSEKKKKRKGYRLEKRED